MTTTTTAGLRRAAVPVLAMAFGAIHGGSALAQGGPPVTLEVEGGITPYAGLRDAASGSAGAEESTRSFSGRLSVPVRLDPRTFLIFDANYRQVQLDVRELANGSGLPGPVLHDVGAGIGLMRVLGPGWTLMLRAGPTVASDLDGDLGRADLAIGGVAVLTRQFDAHWSGSFGAAYFTSLGIPFPVPVLGVSWTDGGRWRASATLPSSLEVWYAAAEATGLGLRVNLDGGEYHVPSLFEAEEARLRRLSVNLGPVASFSFISGVAVDIGGGLTLEQVRLLDGNDDIANGRFDLDARPFLRAGLRLTL